MKQIRKNIDTYTNERIYEREKQAEGELKKEAKRWREKWTSLEGVSKRNDNIQMGLWWWGGAETVWC